jgi:hypothetical protein
MKKIQDIVVGDILKGVSTNNTVLSLLRPQLGNKLLYSINGSDAFVTPNHPFLTTQGWKSIDPDTTRREIASLSVSLLKIGDTLITESGNIIVTSLIPHTADASTQLYNFELDGDHTYFANGLAVHNKNDVESCMAAIYDNNGNDILQYCAGYSYAAPTTNHPNRRIFPNLVNPSQPGALCTTSRDC